MLKEVIQTKTDGLGFVPSEQYLNEPRLNSDIYAVGMIGIYLLTGIPPQELPKNPTNGEVIWEEWAQVNRKTAIILNKMISYNFRDRYQSAFDALETIIKRKNQLLSKKIKVPKIILKILAGAGVGISMFILGGQLITANSTTNNLNLSNYCSIIENKK